MSAFGWFGSPGKGAYIPNIDSVSRAVFDYGVNYARGVARDAIRAVPQQAYNLLQQYAPFPARGSRYPPLMPRIGYSGTYRRRPGRGGYFDHRRLPSSVSRGPKFSQRRARRQAAGAYGVPPTRRRGRFRSNVAVLSRIPAYLMSSRGRRDVRL